MNKFFIIFNLFLITTLSYFGTSFFYKITMSVFGQPAKHQISHAHGNNKYTKPVKPLSQYDTIANRNLFNTPSQSRKTEPVPDTDHLPDTKLKLKLWGTVVGSSDHAYAVIEETDTKTQNLYRKGDTIQQAVVNTILREKVILRINGRDEILEMEAALKNKLAGASGLAGDDAISSEGEQNIPVDRALIDDIIEKRKFFSYARITPDFSNADAVGLKVSKINPDSIIPLLGIKEGDIVTALDGKKFRKTNEVIDYYKSIPSSQGLDLEIFRDGKKMTIHYDFQ